MTHEKYTNLYVADVGKLFIRINDYAMMGNCIDLGQSDSISNYIEISEADVESYLQQNNEVDSISDGNNDIEEGDVL